MFGLLHLKYPELRVAKYTSNTVFSRSSAHDSVDWKILVNLQVLPSCFADGKEFFSYYGLTGWVIMSKVILA